MGGKRRAQPEGNAQGRAAARGDDPGGQGGASRRRQTLGMSEDTLQRVLPLVLGCVDPEVAAQLYQTCTTWRKEMEARGFCNRTVQLCSALAECKDTDDVLQKAVRWLNASNDDGEKAFCVDARAFLERSRGGTGSLREWLQAASQEPDASFVSRGAASTALSLGLKLVHWIGKPQESNAGWETLPRHSNSVSAVAISPDRTRAVSGSNSKLAKIWNTETGAEVYTLTGHSTWVIAVSFFPGGERVLTVSGDSAKIWNVATGAEVCTLTGHFGYDERDQRVAFSTDGKLVVSGSDGNDVKIWNAESGSEICSLHGHSDMVNSAAFSPNGKRVVSVSGDPHYEYSDEYSVRIWDVDMGAEVCALAQPGMVVMASFSPDGKRIVTGSEWGAVKLWNAETGAKVMSFEKAMAFSVAK
ncbi:WD40-repeat-containing domain protein [Baffinella frigidus]|nr:WD40-repeat-containing domain protein [Cryptophyta sp. CCMP2293]